MDSLAIVGVGLFAFAGASLIAAGLAFWTRPRAPLRSATQAEAVVFLFEGQDLVDATPAAHRLLRMQAGGRSDLARMLGVLTRGFGTDLGPRLAGLPAGGRLVLASAVGAGTLEATEEGGALRLAVRPDGAGASAVDQLSYEANQEELQILRGLAEDAPQPIWVLGANGSPTWANRAYLTLSDLAATPDDTPDRPALTRATWPTRPLFEFPSELPEGQAQQARLPLALSQGDEPLWYDVTAVRRGPGSFHFATEVTGLVQAEATRLHFVQTLAKTFADLATGLAIFDRDRRLVLFNPAFLDLTGLPVEFLSGRPLVQAVLDRLRDAKILPEPRDYASWREGVAALQAAAEQGEYCETWTLPGGETYRVTGRPQPDGALAFLFADISGELGLARRVRADLESARHALDAMEEAVAVFDSSGALHLANAAYDALWGSAAPGRRDTDFAIESARWAGGCAPSAFWSRLADGWRDGPPSLAEDLRLADGRRLGLRTTGLPRGATLVAFRADPPRVLVAADSSVGRAPEAA